MATDMPWVVRSDEAPRLGITKDDLRGGAFAQVRHGVWTVAGLDRDDPDVRIAAVAARLPEHAVVSGWAAARVHEMTKVRGDLVVFDGSPRWEVGPARTGGPARVLVTAPAETRMAQHRDLRIFRSTVQADEREVVAGVPVTTALRTAFDLARLSSPRAAVVALDRLLHLGLVESSQLRSRIAVARRWRGRPAATRALDLADGGAESPQETLLRLVWIQAGRPRPRANVEVRDPSGAFVGRVDLLDPVAGVVGEYDGAVHADAGRRRSDHTRHEALQDLGLVVVRAAQGDLANPRAEAAWQSRLHAAYTRARGDPRNWLTSTPSTGARRG